MFSTNCYSNVHFPFSHSSLTLLIFHSYTYLYLYIYFSIISRFHLIIPLFSSDFPLFIYFSIFFLYIFFFSLSLSLFFLINTLFHFCSCTVFSSVFLTLPGTGFILTTSHLAWCHAHRCRLTSLAQPRESLGQTPDPPWMVCLGLVYKIIP